MKRENFERASAINKDIKRLEEIDRVLVKSFSNGNTLGAVHVDCYNHFEVLDSVLLTQTVLSKFRQILADEILRLDKEFEAL